MFYKFAFVALAASILIFGESSQAATQAARKHPVDQRMNERLQKAKKDLAQAAEDYKESLQKLLAFEEDDVKSATEQLEKRRRLLAQNEISTKEVEDSERALETAKAKVRDTRIQLAEAELFAKSAANEANDSSRVKSPYPRELLLRVLKLNALPMQEVKEAVEKRGVSFHLMPEDEAAFSSLGATRDLLRVIASNYRTL